MKAHTFSSMTSGRWTYLCVVPMDIGCVLHLGTTLNDEIVTHKGFNEAFLYGGTLSDIPLDCVVLVNASLKGI